MSTKAPPRGFPPAEFERRCARAQTLMAGARLDALLLTTEHNVRYLTGFQTQFWESPTRPWFVMLPAQGKPIAVIPEIGAAGMAATWLDDIRTWPAPQPDDDGVSLLADTLNSLKRRHGRIGMTLGRETHLRMPVESFEAVRQRLRGFEIADCAPLVHRLRSIKSPAEIAKIRHVCQLTSDAYEALPETAAIGDSERVICRRLAADLLRRGADMSPFLVGASGPGGYDTIIMGPGERLLAQGDVLIIDTGTVFDGYFCDFDRNFAFGPPADDVRRAYAATWRATDAGISVARPGARMCDVWRAMWPLLEEAGALGYEVGRLGHGLGMQLTEWPSVHPDDETVLEPGMVITIEPGMAFAPGRLMVHEENIAITGDAAELLTRRAPAEMPVIG